MSNLDIIRAWKDEEYRQSLSEEERAQLPENPAGLIEMTDAEMEAASGGVTGDYCTTKTLRADCLSSYDINCYSVKRFCVSKYNLCLPLTDIIHCSPIRSS